MASHKTGGAEEGMGGEGARAPGGKARPLRFGGAREMAARAAASNKRRLKYAANKAAKARAAKSAARAAKGKARTAGGFVPAIKKGAKITRVRGAGGKARKG